MTDIVSRRILSILGLAIAAGLALALLFVLSALVGVLFPNLQATHAWVALFTLAPVTRSGWPALPASTRSRSTPARTRPA